MSAAVFTNNIKNSVIFSDKVDAGMIKVNGETTGSEPHVPFGGMKDSSSHSREQGKAAKEFFTSIKTISTTI
ncbi:aldehyde dehydrogenase family protein [Sinobaca sp. H24]|uniref:aldehyde dehydrogenase family protein n=1 Tax=Sinobaca sp. H24 TaxID=2923376 RepID=UPI0035B17D1D